MTNESKDIEVAVQCRPSLCPKGVYPQSDGRLAMIDIDASKGLVDLWEHFFVAIVAIHRNGYQWKRCFFGFD